MSDELRRFCDEYPKLRGLHPENVYTIHVGPEPTTVRLSDLRALLAECGRLAAEVERLRAAMQEIVTQHRPDVLAPGKQPIGCLTCYPADSSWPCVTRMEADDALAALSEEADHG